MLSFPDEEKIDLIVRSTSGVAQILTVDEVYKSLASIASVGLSSNFRWRTGCLIDYLAGP